MAASPKSYPRNVAPLLITGNARYQQATLTGDELNIFDRDLARLASIQSLSRDLTELLWEGHDAFLTAAAVAKAQIGTNPTFGGLEASGNEIGMQLIRAITIRNPGIAAGATAVLSWIQSFAATGWTDLFGSSTNPVDLSQTGSAGSSATNENNRVVLVFGAMIDPLPPKVQEFRFHVNTVDYNVQSVAWATATDLAYAKLPGYFLIPVNGRFNVRANINPGTGQDAIQLFGLTFSTGIYLSLET